jgi:hypothetical protein
MMIYPLRQLTRIELIASEAWQKAAASKPVHLETRTTDVFD